jgi:hypothetical protein
MGYVGLRRRLGLKEKEACLKGMGYVGLRRGSGSETKERCDSTGWGTWTYAAAWVLLAQGALGAPPETFK